MFYVLSVVGLIINMLIAGDVRPLSMKAFDQDLEHSMYGRGSYLIVLCTSSLEPFLSNEDIGGDFVNFKKTQGFDVDVVIYDEIADNESELKEYIMEYHSYNPMLEYVLLVGDVNGSFAIPTFEIPSYNEDDIDVQDYEYTYDGSITEDNSENIRNPHFFIGRWPIRNIQDFLKIKNRSIQYVKMENNDSEKLDNALLVAGNYKTAEGVEVPPSSWPVTPVWTSLWLMDLLDDYNYAQIDTAFFHAGNWETGEYNPTIENAWNDGVGIVNYRGWGDANGWHKPYFHRDDIELLNNGYNLPIVMSFVCNTGDYGNDYSGTGLDKCFGEVLITAGSLTTPKGAAAMIGPSDLDTDTRFNNVLCGLTWDALLENSITELAPALHYGKQGIINEFGELEAENGQNIADFYHHIYQVLGDPSIDPWLLEPEEMFIQGLEDYNNEIISIYNPYLSLNVVNQNSESIAGVVGALLDVDGNLIGKGISDSNGILIIEFDIEEGSQIELYLNKTQFKQSKYAYLFEYDNGESLGMDISCDLNTDIMFNNGEQYLAYGNSIIPTISITNNSEYDLGSINVLLETENNITISPISFTINLDAFQTHEELITFTLNEDLDIGTSIDLDIDLESNDYILNNNDLGMLVSSNTLTYLNTDPSPACDYGYNAYDNYDVGYDERPIYNWIEINSVGTNLNLQDDTLINDLPIGFDFVYFGETYSNITVCSNGWASLIPGQIDYFWNFSIPNPMGPSAMIAPFMDDLDDNDGTEPFNVYAYNDNDERLIVQWDNVSNGEDDQLCPNCIKETFQMILYNPLVYETLTGDGEIVFQYKEIHDIDQNGNYSTIGIESPDQNDGVEYLFNSQPNLGSSWIENDSGIIENLAVKFTTNNPYISSQCIIMDVNNDGIINVIDIVSTVNIIFDVSSPDEQQLCAADANQDGIINVIDIVTIVNYIFSLL